MKPIKELIEQKLENMELEEVALLIAEYHIYNNELDHALQYALKGVQSYPVNGDMYYNLAYIYEMKDDILLAIENYMKAQIIYLYINDTKAKMSEEKKKLY